MEIFSLSLKQIQFDAHFCGLKLSILLAFHFINIKRKANGQKFVFGVLAWYSEIAENKRIEAKK